MCISGVSIFNLYSGYSAVFCINAGVSSHFTFEYSCHVPRITTVTRNSEEHSYGALLDAHFGSAIYHLCDLEQTISCLRAFITSSQVETITAPTIVEGCCEN